MSNANTITVWNTTTETLWNVTGPKGSDMLGVFGWLGRHDGMPALDDEQLDYACDEYDLEAEEA